MKREATITRNEVICAQYNSGVSISDLCSEFSLSEVSIRVTLREGGCALPNSSRKFTDDELRTLLDSGMRTNECARALHVASATVSARLRKLGIRFGSGTVTEDEVKTMLALREEEGLTNAQISARVGKSYATVIAKIGPQPDVITDISSKYRNELIRIRNERRAAAKLAMAQLREEEAKRAEEAARMAEIARVEKENEILAFLSTCGIQPESFRIESAEAGSQFISNLCVKAYEKYGMPV